MPVRCLTGSRFTMNAEVLRWSAISDSRPNDVGHEEPIFIGGQDPITGEILNEWVSGVADNSATSTADESKPYRTIPCVARGIVDGGIRVAGTTERFGDTYENVDFVVMWVPAHIRLTKRDRVTNIRAKANGKVVWLDEEYEEGSRPTVFNVNGVTPLFDAFNMVKEWRILLEKVDN
jgi:hypothetical protein